MKDFIELTETNFPPDGKLVLLWSQMFKKYYLGSYSEWRHKSYATIERAFVCPEGQEFRNITAFCDVGIPAPTNPESRTPDAPCDHGEAWEMLKKLYDNAHESLKSEGETDGSETTQADADEGE